MGYQAGEAGTLSNIGSVYDALGEKKKALEYLSQALLIWRAVGDRAGEARSLNNIGEVYTVLGEKKRALEYFSQALPIWRAVGDRAGEATTLSNIGLVHDDLGEKQAALGNYSQVQIPAGISQGLLISKVNPVYPPLARQARIQGTVTLSALIGKDGSIEELTLVSGHPLLVQAAMDAVKQWRYRPYVVNGEVVPVLTPVNVNFTLQ